MISTNAGAYFVRSPIEFSILSTKFDEIAIVQSIAQRAALGPRVGHSQLSLRSSRNSFVIQLLDSLKACLGLSHCNAGFRQLQIETRQLIRAELSFACIHQVIGDL